MTKTAQKNTQVVIFAGFSPDDIMAAIKKMAFKKRMQKRMIKIKGKNNLLMRKMLTIPTENKIVKPKPKFKTKAAENLKLNSIEKFLTVTQPKSLFASALLKVEITPDDTKTPMGGDKRNASQLDSPESSPEEKAAESARLLRQQIIFLI
jgi:hypothetical protein